MPDVNAITIALAARFAAAQVTPPSGLQNIRSSTGSPPNQLPATPCVIAFPIEGDFRTGQGTRLGAGQWIVRFYYAQTGDILRDSTALQKWSTVLVDQLKGAVQLGGIVARATVDHWKIGIVAYAGTDYSGIELTVEIVTSESWAAVA
jgi:hypothetical protein